MAAASPFLTAISEPDLGIIVEKRDFVGVQSMRERWRQEVSYRSSFGSKQPNIRIKRPGEEIVVSFSFLLLKDGVKKGLNNPGTLAAYQDFMVSCRRGQYLRTYLNCNWTDIDIDSAKDGVTVNVDISVPGFNL